MMVSPMHKIALRARALLDDCRGIVAVEFAVIVPVMLVMYFGMEEFASAVAVNRKVTIVARTLSDLTSQSPSVQDADLANFAQTAKAILTPYDPSILKSSVTEIYIDPTTHVAAFDIVCSKRERAIVRVESFFAARKAAKEIGAGSMVEVVGVEFARCAQFVDERKA